MSNIEDELRSIIFNELAITIDEEKIFSYGNTNRLTFKLKLGDKTISEDYIDIEVPE